ELLIDEDVVDEILEDLRAGLGLLLGRQALEPALQGSLQDRLPVDGRGYGVGRRGRGIVLNLSPLLAMRRQAEEPDHDHRPARMTKNAHQLPSSLRNLGRTQSLGKGGLIPAQGVPPSLLRT